MKTILNTTIFSLTFWLIFIFPIGRKAELGLPKKDSELKIYKASMLSLIAREDFRPTQYKDPGSGRKTIGFGLNEMKGLPIPKEITYKAAIDSTLVRLEDIKSIVSTKAKKEGVKMAKNELAAYSLLAYQTGPSKVFRSKSWKHFIKGNKSKAIELYPKFAHSATKGDVLSRLAEKAILKGNQKEIDQIADECQKFACKSSFITQNYMK